MSHAEAYKEPGTPEEQSRRTFMANAVIAMSGIIGIAIAVPVIASLLPSKTSGTDIWSGLTPEQADAFKKATAQTPIQVTFDVHEDNAYFGATNTAQFVWAVRATEAQMQHARPDLFTGSSKVDYPVVNLGFVVFSPICPHLGCRYLWIDAQKKFMCPCHGSIYSPLGIHLAGPALRGLDPLPLRDYQGQVQVTWIEYAPNTPSRVVLKVG